MGDLADAAMEGTLCTQCGDLLINPYEEKPAGSPGVCEACQPPEEDPLWRRDTSAE
jgi:hypothetical protein